MRRLTHITGARTQPVVFANRDIDNLIVPIVVPDEKRQAPVFITGPPLVGGPDGFATAPGGFQGERRTWLAVPERRAPGPPETQPSLRGLREAERNASCSFRGALTGHRPAPPRRVARGALLAAADCLELVPERRSFDVQRVAGYHLCAELEVLVGLRIE